uniref:Asparagine synthase (Glutamine-hydrolysing) n=1 Tax=Laurencia verruciformis TaxID=3073068 RepID=A0AA51NFA2_9FLOR|nr:asparagine synthase (glutamine-hydrolyzing) [Laurencia obtusa]WMP12221.1 Asparagine synthase (Glutamine-hydrolysing) [Laurencia verruciformis]WMP12865.1 asparagine synthase (glutamine-hydrolyzing) [Laurencia obtusa]
MIYQVKKRLYYIDSILSNFSIISLYIICKYMKTELIVILYH